MISSRSVCGLIVVGVFTFVAVVAAAAAARVGVVGIVVHEEVNE